MSSSFDALAKSLQPHYSAFRVTERLLFSGHSHQAWPDVALSGQIEAFEAAAQFVDDKWGPAFEKTDVLRGWLREFYDDPDGYYSCAPNTHDLLIKWLSALDLKPSSKIVTTDAEFYSVFRQMRRFREAGITVVEVPHLPLESFPDRLIREIDESTSAVILSRIYFQSSLVASGLSEIALACHNKQIPILIDDYHGTNVIPLSLNNKCLNNVYLLIGGYKYLQWGEGNCFLRFPKDCQLRPLYTGWFASFQTLTLPREKYTVQYDGEQRFGGATYEPVSQFRAAKVVAFFRENGLTPHVLHRTYKDQIALMNSQFIEQDKDPKLIRLTHNYPVEKNGGFLSLTTPHAQSLCKNLKERNIFSDCRGEIIRFGPAPYIDSDQICQLFAALDEEIKLFQ